MFFRLINKNTGVILICLLSYSGIGLALGVNTIKANEFVSACQLQVQTTANESANKPNVDNGSKMNLCLAYLQGYFAGTEEIVVEEKIPSDFMLRALKTRGHRLNEAQQKLLSSRYCISEQESLKDFAEKVAQLDANFAESAAASKAVESVLEQHYLCDRK